MKIFEANQDELKDRRLDPGRPEAEDPRVAPAVPCGPSVTGVSYRVMPPVAAEGSTPFVVDIDANGVDRAQIRAMLDLTPEARLRKVEDFAQSVIEIRERNGELPNR
jgi:hypothetical protein